MSSLFERIEDAGSARPDAFADTEGRRIVCERCVQSYSSGDRLKCKLCNCGEPWLSRARCPVFKWGSAREMPLPMISVVINAANSGDRLRLTIQSFRENLGEADHEFVVVADCVDDGSLSGLGEGVRIVRREGRMIGCCQGKIEGANAAKGGVLMFFDCHCAVFAGDLAELAAEAIRRKAIVCPVLADMGYDDGRPVRRDGDLQIPESRNLGFHGKQYRGIREESLKGRLRRVDAGGMGASMTRETYERMGGWPWLPERYGSEQAALSRKAFLAGVDIFAHEGVVVGHYFRHGEKRPYTPPSKAGAVRNEWASWLTLVEPDTFNRRIRPKLLEKHGNKWGPDVEFDPAVQAARAAFRPFKRRDDMELLASAAAAEAVRVFGTPLPSPKVSAVVPAKDEGGELRATVEHLLEKGVDEVVVVDDGSTDGCADGLDSVATVIRNPETLGTGVARNQGAAAAAGDALLFLDAHQRILSGSVQELARIAMVRDAMVCAAVTMSGLDYSPPKDGRRWIYGASFKRHKHSLLMLDHNRPEPGRRISEIECPVGGCYAIPKKVFDAMGGWVATRGWGYNEQAMALKLWAMGTPLLLDRDVRAAHLMKRGSRRVSRRFNAWHVHYVCSEQDTFERYWSGVLESAFGEWIAKKAREMLSEDNVRMEAEEFRRRRVRPDAEWFKETENGA